MGAVWFRFRTEIRGRWRAWIVLAVLAGLVGGVVLAALAGARRTEAAYPGFVQSQRAYDVVIANGNGGYFPFAEFDFDEIAALPEVAESARLGVPIWYAPSPNGKSIDSDTVTSLVPLAGGFGTRFNTLHMVEGRAPHRPYEIAPSLVAAQRFDLQVGDVLPGRFVPRDIVERYFSEDPTVGGDTRALPVTELRVSGIAAAPGEFPPIEESTGNDPFIHFAPGFKDTPGYYSAIDVLAVRVKGGESGVRSFVRELERRAKGRGLFTIEQAAASAATQRSISVQADALRVLALVAAVAGILLIGQLLLRQSRFDGAENPALRAIGMSPPQLLGIAGLRAAVLGVLAAVTAVALALLLSPLMPIGLARDAETRLGVDADVLVLGAGALGVCAVVWLISILGAWLVARSASRAPDDVRPRRHPRLTERMAQSGFSPTAVNGVRLAVESGRGNDAAPARSTLLVVLLAVASIVAVISFSTDLDHLLDTPRLYGWNWDAAMGDQFTPNTGRKVAQELADDDRIAGLAVGTVLSATVDDQPVEILAADPVKGGLAPAISDGRAPRGAREVAFGGKTLRELEVEVGDTVVLEFSDRRAPMRIVGEAVLPGFGAGGGLGEGAAMSLAAARRFAPRAPANIVLVDVGEDNDVRPVVRRMNGFRDFADSVEVPTRPTDLDNLARVGSIPFVIAAVMVLVALVTIVHGLVTSVRRRRRELALLKTLGLRTGQIVRVVLWQATTIAVIALVVGVPVGLLAGNLAWRTYANQLGAVPETALSAALLVLLVPLVLLATNVAAAIPGSMAARVRPALVLRSE